MADELLDRLRRQGSLVSSGELELDRAEAREKLQKFRLHDPHHYVLQLVQAAYLLDATKIYFCIDADEVEMLFDGEPLPHGWHDDIYDAALSSQSDPETRALRHLAIGLTTAHALEPSVVRIEVTCDGKTTALVEIDGEEQTEHLDTPEKEDGTRVYIREKFRASHLVDFFRDLSGDLAKETALRDYCASSTREIYLDGEPISFGHGLPPDAVGRIAFETDYERGLVGVRPDGERAKVTILQNGVEVTELRMQVEHTGAYMVIESDRLTRTLSQNVFVEDKHWRDFIDYVLPTAVYASIQTFVSALDSEQFAEHREWVQRVCNRVLPELEDLTQKNVEMRRRVYGLAKLADAIPSLVESLRAAPIWLQVDPSTTPVTEKWVALDALVGDRQAASREPVVYTREYDGETTLESAAPAMVFPDGPPPIFEHLWAAQLVEITEDYVEGYERAASKRRWQARPWRERPELDAYPHQEPFEAGAVHATLAVGRVKHPARVTLVKDGHLLDQYTLAEKTEAYHPGETLLPPGIAIWFGGELEANRRFDDVEPDAAFGAVAKDLIAALPDFIATHVHRFEPCDLRRYLAHFLSGKIDDGLFRTFQLADRWAWLKQLVGSRPKSGWALRLLPADQRSLLPEVTTSAVDHPPEHIEYLGDLAHIPLFETVNDGMVSLAMLSADPQEPLVNVDRFGEVILDRLFTRDDRIDTRSDEIV